MRALALLLLAIVLPLVAQDKKKVEPKDTPHVLHPVPLAAAPGFKGKVLLRGLKLDDATEVKATDPKAVVKLVGKPKKAGPPKDYPAEKAGDTELELELELPKDFAANHVSLVITNPKGTSAPFKLLVDASPRTAEKEPNNDFATAQELVLPTTVDAVLSREHDFDLFRFAGKAGNKLHVEVKAARLGAPTDAYVVVYDADKRIIETGDDAEGTTDPILHFTLPRDGVYFVSVIEAHDAGGPMFAYRLVMTKTK